MDIYDEWRRDYEERKCLMRARLETALASRLPVLESWEAVSGPKRVAWELGKTCFMEPWSSDPAYIAAHLESRHFGFGWDLEIDGVTYRMGKVLEFAA